MAFDLSWLKKRKSFSFVERTHVGLVREQNEDSLAVCPDAGFFVVADGMGGLTHGDAASRIAVESIVQAVKGFAGGEPDVGAMEACLRDAFVTAHDCIVGYGNAKWPGRTIGTTGLAFWFSGASGVVCHVGDSRLYRWREGALEQVTQDHTLVRELVDMGRLTPEEAENSPYAHKLTRALGVQKSHKPETNRVDIQIGDVYLLCSDGLYGFVGNDVLAGILAGVTRKNIETMAERLESEALRGGGHDNISLILICINKI